MKEQEVAIYSEAGAGRVDLAWASAGGVMLPLEREIY